MFRQLLFFTVSEQVQSEYGVGDYTKSDGTCVDCYYYCVTCDGLTGFYNCPRDCGCFNNYTSDCGLRNWRLFTGIRVSH